LEADCRTPQLQWKKLSILLKGNRFKKTPAVVDAKLIHTLDVNLDPPTEASGGLDGDDLEQMAILTGVKHLRVRVGKDVRLKKMCGGKFYVDHLANLARLDGTGPSSIERLQVSSYMPQGLDDCLELASALPNLRHLSLDSIKPPRNLRNPSLPHLRSFKLRSPEEITFNPSLFSFLVTKCQAISALSITGIHFDADFLKLVLRTHTNTLKVVELGTAGHQSCIGRMELAWGHHLGQVSVDTGIFLPIEMLENTERVGDIAAEVCSDLTTLSVGGPLSTSTKLLNILSDPARPQLNTLRLHDAGPLRAVRPGSDPSASREKELVEEHPSGISPQDVLDAFEDGFFVQRLEVRGMGAEWDFSHEENARKVAEECEKRGIAFVH
jgi:hypothetical protein